MRHVDQGFDHATAGQAFAGPGMDTRQWVSYGQVDQDTQDSRCVVFDPDLGPLVNVTLQPSGIPVVCRVLAPFAGQGESEYFPFISGDEVVVAITQGDERGRASSSAGAAEAKGVVGRRGGAGQPPERLRVRSALPSSSRRRAPGWSGALNAASSSAWCGRQHHHRQA